MRITGADALTRGGIEAGSARLRLPELAWMLEQLVVRGLRGWERGWCLGELEARELAVGPCGVVVLPPRSARELRARRRRVPRHLRRGHDAGCLALGVPRSTVHRVLLDRAARPDAAELLLDAADEIIEVLGASGRPFGIAAALSGAPAQRGGGAAWETAEPEPGRLREAVHGIIASRVRPRRPPVDRTAVTEGDRHDEGAP